MHSNEPLTLHAIYTQRIAALDADARAVLEMLCVAAAPTPEALALRAIGVTPTHASARKLVASGLAIRVGLTGHHLIPFHGSLRTTVLEQMSPDVLEALHLRWARTLEESGEVEADVLVVHYLAGGAKDEAIRHMRRSARRLSEALAFDGAVSMYKRLLALTAEAPQRMTEPSDEVGEELAVALENAGRCEEAGRLWLSLAKLGGGERRDAMRQRAAENLIHAGHIDEGLAIQKSALSRLGVRISRSAWRAIPFIVVDRIRLRLRGLRYRLQPAASADPRRLARIDGGMALGAVLPLIDTIRGLQIHSQALRDALIAGEPARLARALARAVHLLFDQRR
ncbi:MAG TPA: hypothetical protein PK095_02700, partial [Myxococcota bacterium]|nr:hypothetical protein [Myxococcota bacterium]